MYPDLADIMPHKPPMILIDRVEECDLRALTLKASVRITEDSLFFDAALGGVPAWLGMEYMAQAVGALFGLWKRERNEGEQQLGFILGTRKYENAVPYFANGGRYFIDVSEIFFDSEIGSFSCTASDALQGGVCAKAELNVFTPKNVKDFLHG